MANRGKVIQYGNFNITFGEDNVEKPMLTRFLDIVYPALKSGIQRGKTDPIFSFLNVEVKEIDGELVLVGDFVKHTKYDVYSTLENGKLESTNREILTSPFSRFVVFLKNHRVVLAKNESKSPDLRSLNATVEYVLDEFVRNENSKINNMQLNDIDKQKRYLPYPIVNIVGLPKTAASLEVELKKLKKIKTATFRLFPLNSDIDPVAATKYIREAYLESTDTNRASIILRSPRSKSGLAKLVSATEGTVAVNIVGETEEKQEVTIKEDDIATKTKLPYDDNLIYFPDDKLIKHAKSSVELITSTENKKLYDSMYERIKRIIK